MGKQYLTGHIATGGSDIVGVGVGPVSRIIIMVVMVMVVMVLDSGGVGRGAIGGGIGHLNT